MPDLKLIPVFYEGDDDKAVLEALQELKRLPAGWQITKRDKDKHAGKDGLIGQLLPFILPNNGVGGSAVALVDLDELTFADRSTWFHQRLMDSIPKHDPPLNLARNPHEAGRLTAFELTSKQHRGQLVLVPVGIPDAKDLGATFGIDRFAMDDYLLHLMLNPSVYESVSEVKTIPFETARKKLIEMASLLRSNGLEVRTSKRYIQFLRAVAALGPSTATILGRFVKAAGTALPLADFAQLFDPLLNDLAEADRLLRA